MRTPLDPMDITGALVSADAAHTCAQTARHLVEDKGADYLLTIKGNRPSLHAAAVTAARMMIRAKPDHVSEQRSHRRINRWTTWATRTDEGSTCRTRPGWPSSAATPAICPDSHSPKRSRSWSPVAFT